jgi:cell division protein ZapE
MIWNECTNSAAGEMLDVKVAQGRTLTIPKFHAGVANMSFYDLCGNALGNPDYMAL